MTWKEFSPFFTPTRDTHILSNWTMYESATATRFSRMCDTEIGVRAPLQGAPKCKSDDI